VVRAVVLEPHEAPAVQQQVRGRQVLVGGVDDGHVDERFGETGEDDDHAQSRLARRPDTR